MAYELYLRLYDRLGSLKKGYLNPLWARYTDSVNKAAPIVFALNTDSESVFSKAEQIYNDLQTAGVDVLIDDREVRPGVKFKDADLIGLPLRVVVGERALAEGNVEIKLRTDDKPTSVPFDQAVEKILEMVRELKA